MPDTNERMPRAVVLKLAKQLRTSAILADANGLCLGNGAEIGSLLNSMADELESREVQHAS